MTSRHDPKMLEGLSNNGLKEADKKATLQESTSCKFLKRTMDFFFAPSGLEAIAPGSSQAAEVDI